MAQTRRTGMSANAKTSYRNSTRQIPAEYVYGTAAYDTRIRRQLEEEPRRRLSNETRKNRDKARHMSFGYVAFLMAALCVCAIVLIHYVQLQTELTDRTESVARLESELNNLKLANDEEYNRITRNIDLEEIKRIAISELGMTYAREGQIILYSSTGADYMRQSATAD